MCEGSGNTKNQTWFPPQYLGIRFVVFFVFFVFRVLADNDLQTEHEESMPVFSVFPGERTMETRRGSWNTKLFFRVPL